jgi:hypothetical protein
MGTNIDKTSKHLCTRKNLGHGQLWGVVPTGEIYFKKRPLTCECEPLHDGVLPHPKHPSRVPITLLCLRAVDLLAPCTPEQHLDKAKCSMHDICKLLQDGY